MEMRYSKYKSSGVEWIGEIPLSWTLSKFKFITEMFNGDSLNDEQKIQFESEDIQDTPYVSSKDINLDYLSVNYNNGLRIPKSNNKLKIGKKGGFLLCIEGGSSGRKMVFLEEDVCFVNKLCYFNSPNNLSKFLFYFVRSNQYQSQFKLSLTGLIGGVSVSSLKNFEIPLPPITEQVQIVKYLDEKTTQIDNLISITENKIELLKQKRTSLISEVVTKGLNKDVELKDSGVEWIGNIPKHWVVKKMKYLVKICNGSDYKEFVLEDGGYPVYGTGGVFSRSSKFIYNEISVLLGRKGSVDKPQIVEEPFWTSDTTYYTKINSNVEPFFFFHLVNQIQFDLYIYGSTIPSMTKSVYDEMLFPYPPITEQKKIVEYIDKETSKIDDLISIEKRRINTLKEFRQSLISEVVTGKIKVSNN
jgi:type I restriction enzyme S subunit